MKVLARCVGIAMEGPDLRQVRGTTTNAYQAQAGTSRRSDDEVGQRWTLPAGLGSFARLPRCSSLMVRSAAAPLRSSRLGSGQNSASHRDANAVSQRYA